MSLWVMSVNLAIRQTQMFLELPKIHIQASSVQQHEKPNNRGLDLHMRILL